MIAQVSQSAIYCMYLQDRFHIVKIHLPVIPVYPLGLAEGPITATKVASSRAVILFAGKASHCWHDSWTLAQLSAGVRPR